jgi:LPS-assembly protein
MLRTLGVAVCFVPLLGFGDFINLTAQSVKYFGEKQLLEAFKNVEITQKNFFTRADRLKYDLKKGIVYAEGNVFITNNKDIFVHADRLVYYLNSGLIKLFNAKGKLKEGYFSAKVLRIKGKIYIFKGFCGTKCSDKSAEVCSKKFVYNQKSGEGTLYSAKIKVENIPIFYTPYYGFLTKRKTGFLTPTLGFDVYSDFIYQQPFYWAIDEHSDLTFTGDYRTANFYGGNVFFRKYFSSDTYLETLGGFYYDNAYPGKWWEGRTYHRKNRYLFSAEGYKGNLKFGWELPSDKDFYYDVFFADENLHYKSFAKSYLSYLINDRGFYLNLKTEYFYNLLTENRSEDLALLPDVEFYLKPVRFWKDFSFDLSTELTNFYRYGHSVWRFRLNPQLVFEKNFGTIPLTFYLKPYFLYYSSKYYGNYRYVGGVEFKAKSLFYDFDLIRTSNWNVFSSWEGVYQFSPVKEHPTPHFDNFEEISQKNIFILKGINDISYKGKKIGEILLEQGYNFYSGYNLPTDGYPMGGCWLPLKVYTSFNTLSDDISFYGQFYYDYKLKNLIYSSTGIDWKLIRTLLTKVSLRFSYSLSKNHLNQIQSEGFTYGTDIRYRKIYFTLSGSYDNKLNKNTSLDFTISCNRNCWSTGLTYQREYNRDSGDYEWRVLFTFSLFGQPLNLYLNGGKN